MPLLDLIKKRQSTRAYDARPVEREKLERCLEAARLAPSACNAQPWRFIVVDDKALKDEVAHATFGKLVSFNHFTMQAPVLVLAVAEVKPGSATFGSLVRGVPLHYIDMGIATGHFCLQAAEEGLGTCILGWVKEGKIRRLLRVPGRKKIVLAIAVGYPATDEIREKKRKTIDEIREFNAY
jgi:nitroreductase